MKKVVVKRKGNEIISVSATVEPIDYDKLAEAIVVAQEKANKKKKRTSRFRGAVMGGINGVLYLIVTLFSVGAIVGMWMEYAIATEHSLITYIGCTIMFAVIGLFAFLCQQESLGDSDEDAQQHFNTNMALIALIVALVALVKR